MPSHLTFIPFAVFLTVINHEPRLENRIDVIVVLLQMHQRRENEFSFPTTTTNYLLLQMFETPYQE